MAVHTGRSEATGGLHNCSLGANGSSVLRSSRVVFWFKLKESEGSFPKKLLGKGSLLVASLNRGAWRCPAREDGRSMCAVDNTHGVGHCDS